jgi:hypothetical protein
MSIVFNGQDSKVDNIIYNGVTGTLYGFTNPATPRTMTVSGKLNNSIATAWIIGGGGGGGGGDSSSNGGGGGGGMVINEYELGTLGFQDDTLDIHIGSGGENGSGNLSGSAGSGTTGGNTYISKDSASTTYISAKGGGGGGGSEFGGDDATDADLPNYGLGGNVREFGKGGLSLTCGGGGGGGGNTSNANAGNGGSTSSDGNSNGNYVAGVTLSGTFTNTGGVPVIPEYLIGEYTAGDGGAAGQGEAQVSRYGSGGQGGSTGSDGINGGNGALFIFVRTGGGESGGEGGGGGGGNPVCFLRGSKILCLNEGLKEEYMAIENMRVGTKVKTLNGSYVKVHTIGKTTFNNPDNADIGPNRLFKLTPQNYPELTEDLIITGCHSILVDKLLPHQKARHLQLMKSLYMTTGKFRLMAFIDEKAEPYQNPGDHEIWHFALENEEDVCNYGVYANGGLLVESASIKIMTERSYIVLIE